MSMTEDELFASLDDDLEGGFVALYKYYLDKLYNDNTFGNDASNFFWSKQKFIVKISTLAEELGIPGFNMFGSAPTQSKLDEIILKYENVISSIEIRSKIRKNRIGAEFSVMFSSNQKSKLHFFIGQIRDEINASSFPIEKKEAIFKKLSSLELEIDLDRTTFARVTDTIRALARLSGDVEREGAEPWWKWVKGIFGIIDDAKESEPPRKLPAPPEPPKRLEPPSNRADSEDDIPF